MEEKEKRKNRKRKNIESYDGWMCVCRDRAEYNEQ